MYKPKFSPRQHLLRIADAVRGWFGSRSSAGPPPPPEPEPRPRGLSLNYTKKGPGRVHCVGPGRPYRLRSRVSREGLHNPWCPTGDEPHIHPRHKRPA